MKRLLIMALTVCVSGCASDSGLYDLATVPEFRPGMPVGYLAAEELPNSLAFLPPPPADGSAALARDREVAAGYVSEQGNERFTQAGMDAILEFPEATHAFQCIMDVPITDTATPRLYMLMRRSLLDTALATYTAKNHYKRPRPFMENGGSTCAPGTEERLSNDGSYPSGHSALGYGWGLILAGLDPANADALVKRGWDFAQSRAVCNVHWQSDVDAGRLVGATTVARLHHNADFRADLGAAADELVAAREAGLKPEGCNPSD